MEEKNKIQIYCDLDGVLTDFDGRFFEKSGVPSTRFKEQYGEESFWAEVGRHGVAFWAGMKWTADGRCLWEYLLKYDPEILSAQSKDSNSRIGKNIWIKRELRIDKVKVHIVWRKQKQQFAGNGNILIDDRNENIQEWEANGGKGILHTSAENSISNLKNLGY